MGETLYFEFDELVREDDDNDTLHYVSDMFQEDFMNTTLLGDDFGEDFHPIDDFGEEDGLKIIEEVVAKVKELYYGYTDVNGKKVIGELEKYNNNREDYDIVDFNYTIVDIIDNIYKKYELLMYKKYDIVSNTLSSDEQVKIYEDFDDYSEGDEENIADILIEQYGYPDELNKPFVYKKIVPYIISYMKSRLCINKKKYALIRSNLFPDLPLDVIGEFIDGSFPHCKHLKGSKILHDWNEHQKEKMGGGAIESKSGQQFKFTPKVMKKSSRKRSIKRKSSRKRSIKRKTSRKRSIKRKTSRKRSIKRKTSRKRSIKRKTSRKRSIKRKTSRKRSIKRRI
jgi:hypothetical protein